MMERLCMRVSQGGNVLCISDVLEVIDVNEKVSVIESRTFSDEFSHGIMSALHSLKDVQVELQSLGDIDTTKLIGRVISVGDDYKGDDVITAIYFTGFKIAISR